MIETAWIIDDDEIYRYGFSKFVANKALCKNLIVFGNIIEAINILTTPNEILTLPDIIFISVDIEDSNCWNFLMTFETLKAQLSFKKIAIYLLTSSINYLDIERSQNYPDIADYMIKPIDSQQFMRAFHNRFLYKSA
jgi:two-component SAPR family response regulator